MFVRTFLTTYRSFCSPQVSVFVTQFSFRLYDIDSETSSYFTYSFLLVQCFTWSQHRSGIFCRICFYILSSVILSKWFVPFSCHNLYYFYCLHFHFFPNTIILNTFTTKSPYSLYWNITYWTSHFSKVTEFWTYHIQNGNGKDKKDK